MKQGVVKWAFTFSVVMAAVCLLISVGWLVYYQFNVFTETSSIMKDARQTGYPDLVLKSQMQALFLQATPISCGVLAGVGLIFVGFALFLISLDGILTIGVEGEYEKAKVKFVNMSPGILVIIIAVVQMGFCISRYQSFEPKVFTDWQSSPTNVGHP